MPTDTLEELLETDALMMDSKLFAQRVADVGNYDLMKLTSEIDCYAQLVRHLDLQNAKTPGITRRLVYLGSHGHTAGIIHGRRLG